MEWYCNITSSSAGLVGVSGRVRVVVRDKFTKRSQICVETTPRVPLTSKVARGHRIPADSAFLIIVTVTDVTNDGTRNANGVTTSGITTIESGRTIVCRHGMPSMPKSDRRRSIRPCLQTTVSIKSRRDTWTTVYHLPERGLTACHRRFS